MNDEIDDDDTSSTSVSSDYSDDENLLTKEMVEAMWRKWVMMIMHIL